MFGINAAGKQKSGGGLSRRGTQWRVGFEARKIHVTLGTLRPTPRIDRKQSTTFPIVI
jgi:hypothetical protein